VNVRAAGVWILPVFGLLIMLLGVYVAGGTTMTCARSRLMPAISEAPEGTRPPLVAECRVETRRWLARKVIGERTYLRVTKTDAIAVSRTETSTDSNGRRTSRTVDDWYLQLFDGDNEILRLDGTREQIDREKARLAAWFAEGGAEPLHASFSQWSFAYGAFGFGLVWTIITSFIARLVNTADGRSGWRSGGRRPTGRRRARGVTNVRVS
jgi:hypothetical protein